jgi:hypothetical protein
MMNPGEPLIHQRNFMQHIQPVIDGERKMHGLDPRNFAAKPVGSMRGAPTATFTKYPRDQWPALLREQTLKKGRCSDARETGMNGQRIPSRDQNGRGYCWAHSTVSATLIDRATANLPYADLSAYAIACMIKGFRDQGGSNDESMQFIREKGCPTSATWAQKSTSRSNDNPATWEEAAKYKMQEWNDIPEGDFDMQATFSLLGRPFAIDLNWWSHSICGCDLVDGTASYNAGLCRAESGKLMTYEEFNDVWEVDDFGAAFGLRIWNSWGGHATASTAWRSSPRRSLATTAPSPSSQPWQRDAHPPCQPGPRSVAPGHPAAGAGAWLRGA